jgi:hypothetical protein
MRRRFSDSLGAAWLLFLLAAVLALVTLFAGAWIGRQAAALKAPEWAGAAFLSIVSMMLIVALVRRITR